LAPSLHRRSRPERTPRIDGFRFDALSRSLTTAGSRRRALTGLVSGTLGLVGARAEQTAARTCKTIKKKAKRKKCLAKAKGCVPNCVDKLCGSDGCTGTCGKSCVAPETCQNGECLCTRSCAPTNACGPDGCNGSCGVCSGGSTCSAMGVCECGTGSDLCHGICRALCIDGRVRPPNGCDCCYPKGAGPFADEIACSAECCSRECDVDPSGSGLMCAGFALCARCTVDDQCIDGAECQGGRCVQGPTFCPD